MIKIILYYIYCQFSIINEKIPQAQEKKNYVLYFIDNYLELNKRLHINPTTIKVIDFKYVI